MSDEFDVDDFLAELDENVDEPTVESDSVVIILDDTEHTIKEGTIPWQPAMELKSLREEYLEFLLAYQKRADDIKGVEKEIADIRKRFEAELQDASNRLVELNSGWPIERSKKWDYERRVQVAEAALRQAFENERASKEYLENSSKYDQITLNLPWREWALPHQIEGAKLLASSRRGAILGDEMGLGKSLTSLIACDMTQAQRILIIVPDDVVKNFVQEVNRWAPHRTAFILGKQTPEMRKFTIDFLKTLAAFTVVINYSAWRKDKNLLNQLGSLRFDTIIADEAHVMKGTSTSAYKGVYDIVFTSNSCPRCGGAIQIIRMTDDQIELARESSNEGRILSVTKQYWACIGTKRYTVSYAPLSLEASYVEDGCGWNELIDACAGNSLEFGDLWSVKKIYTLTGTPILNSPVDLFASLSLIDPENYTEKYDFESRFCEKGWDNKWRFRPGGLDRLVVELRGKFVARKRGDAGIKLPPQHVTIHSLELDPVKYAKQYKVIRDLTQHSMVILESGKKLPAMVAIALITRKRQANVWPAGIQVRDPETGIVLFSVGDEVQESLKLDTICDNSGDGWVREWSGDGDITNGDRIVIFSQFATPLAELERRINNAGISCVRFDGSTPEYIKDQVRQDFDRTICDQPGYQKKWQVALVNYKSGGVGLNFTSATQTIILDEEWNPGKRNQAYGRSDRIGQTEETNVHVMRIERTVDSWLADLIDNKEEMIEGFEGETKEMQSAFLEAMKNGEMI